MLAAESTILTHQHAHARAPYTHTHTHAHNCCQSPPPPPSRPELSWKKFEEEQHGGTRVRACAAAPPKEEATLCTYLNDLSLRADRGSGFGEPSLQAGRVRSVISIGTGLEQNHLHERGILGESGSERSGRHGEQQEQRGMDPIGASPCWDHHLAGWICADRDIISHGLMGRVAVAETGSKVGSKEELSLG